MEIDNSFVSSVYSAVFEARSKGQARGMSIVRADRCFRPFWKKFENLQSTFGTIGLLSPKRRKAMASVWGMMFFKVFPTDYVHSAMAGVHENTLWKRQ